VIVSPCDRFDSGVWPARGTAWYSLTALLTAIRLSITSREKKHVDLPAPQPAGLAARVGAHPLVVDHRVLPHDEPAQGPVLGPDLERVAGDDGLVVPGPRRAQQPAAVGTVVEQA